MKDYVQGGTLTEVTDLILLSLYEPRHGYAIIQFVEEVTNGRVLLGAGTLYGALSSLEQKGWIKLQRYSVSMRNLLFLCVKLFIGSSYAMWLSHYESSFTMRLMLHETVRHGESYTLIRPS